MPFKKRRSSVSSLPPASATKSAAISSPNGNDPSRPRTHEDADGMGEFEDAWEDEFEDDEEGSVHVNEDSEDDEEEDIPGAGKPDDGASEAIAH